MKGDERRGTAHAFTRHVKRIGGRVGLSVFELALAAADGSVRGMNGKFPRCRDLICTL
jgi:hypothetical protein